MLQAAIREWFDRTFHITSPPTLSFQSLTGWTLAAVELRCDTSHRGWTDALVDEHAYLVGLQMETFGRHELWIQGQSVSTDPVQNGMAYVLDLSQSPVLYLEPPFHHLMFYIPKMALAEAGRELGGIDTHDLLIEPGRSVNDHVIRDLGRLLLPYVQQPMTHHRLLADSLLLALRGHLAATYGGLRPNPLLRITGLAPWQQRKARELMREHLAEGISLPELAMSCRLSPSAFVKSFKKTFGVTPHQWLLQKRIDYAISMMSDSRYSLADIALSSGFSDQSHFTRIFTRRMGASPGVYRRANRAAIA
ncbi:AraC family transcriptional regulator [Dyella sp. A6]|uniref:AraC family transcriptional regulator n=1 Tax=Dyella aluminiiresistens TaxID=3069105 RepID=UPI002E798236|nr:AraC family transcriptional regulator [Dyella sp. A6]